MGLPLKDITGQKFNKLTVISRVENIRSSATWLCKCDCGNEVVVVGNKLRSGHTKSCNCVQKEKAKFANYKHGLHGEPEYKVWQGIKERCMNPNNISYKTYGALGIKMCDRWINNFELFYQDMGKRPTPKHSIDRIDVYKGYSPDNCKWSTSLEQGKNTTRNVWVEYRGERKIIAEWCRIFNVKPGAIRYQMNTKEPSKVFDLYANKN